jgi:DNA modification methylase
MIDFGFYNMDCMEGMKQFPDKYFELAIVDPPYGDALSSGDREGGVLEQVRSEVRQVQDITLSESGRRTAVIRTGGTWAEKYAKKS